MKITCRWSGFKTNRDGDARLGALAALVTVQSAAERADAGREGREGEVVVVPLAEQGHHVSVVSVTDHGSICRSQNVVGHLSHLSEENGSVSDLNKNMDEATRMEG